MSDMLKIAEPMELNDDDIFVLVVHGFVPEFYDDFAFRIDKSEKHKRRKTICCPYCGKKFEMVSADVKVEVYRHSKKSEEICHSFRCCKLCHKTVGIKFA